MRYVLLSILPCLSSLYLAWSRDKYKDAFLELLHKNDVLEQVNERIANENTHVKEAVTNLYKKPVYALLTEEQVHQIGQTVAAHLDKKTWLN